MDNYFTSFCLLTHLGVNNTGATGVFRKNSLQKKQQKNERGNFEQWTSNKKSSELWQ